MAVGQNKCLLVGSVDEVQFTYTRILVAIYRFLKVHHSKLLLPSVDPVIDKHVYMYYYVALL